MAEQELVKKQETSPVERPNMGSPTRYMTPAVDILETDENLILIVDLPGVDKEGLSIHLEKGLLTIQGEVKSLSKGNSIIREFGLANYYRQFQVFEHIDSEKISAALKNGELTLTIPKAETAKPKRIVIN